jgi:hypothetical protein
VYFHYNDNINKQPKGGGGGKKAFVLLLAFFIEDDSSWHNQEYLSYSRNEHNNALYPEFSFLVKFSRTFIKVPKLPGTL